jgi:hypothetical protein
MEASDNFNNSNLTRDFKFGAEEQVKLITRFFTSYNKEQVGPYQSLVLDLYRAITCYRLYDNLETFFEVNPELEACREDIVDLWKEFQNLSHEELAEISIKLLEDL